MSASPTARRPEPRIAKPACRTPLRAGVTLLEVMLALMLFAGSTVAVVGAMQDAHVGVADSENVLTALSLAQYRMEQLRNTVYSTLASESKASITTPSGYTRFSRAVTVTTPYTNLKQVVVTVYWTTPAGETNVSLQTYRSNS